MGRAIGPQRLGQLIPLTAATQSVENTVEHLSSIRRRSTSTFAGHVGVDHRFDQAPQFVVHFPNSRHRAFLSRFAHRPRSRLTLVSRFYSDANLYAPPPGVRGKKIGRPRKKGRKLPAPAEVVQRSSRTRLTAAWYGGGQRRIEVVSGVGHWFKNGEGLVPIRWVFVHDLGGTHRDEYFFTTDPAMAPRTIVETYTRRGSIETTFQEMRAYLGLETTRGRTEKTVLRAAPCLFGLFSVIVLLYARLPANRVRAAGVVWPGKTEAMDA